MNQRGVVKSSVPVEEESEMDRNFIQRFLNEIRDIEAMNQRSQEFNYLMAER